MSTRNPPYIPDLATPLPALIKVEEIRRRLASLFPDTFPNRSILVGQMAARAIFVFLYGGFINGSGRYLRPSHVYLFTQEQSKKVSDEDRKNWILSGSKSGFRPSGKRWYADTSREPIRDDLIRNRLVELGVVEKRPGLSTTSSIPIYYLHPGFAALFDPKLASKRLQEKLEEWRRKNLRPATLQRMKLRAHGVHAREGDLYIEMPDGSRMRVAAGESNVIVKGLVEDFAKIHLQRPIVLWLSASDRKAYPQFVELSAKVGLRFNPSNELPDVILGDLGNPVRFIMCEVVASDGAVTESRREALLKLIKASNVPKNSVRFLSAFEDREAAALRKNFSQLANGSLVWFRTEPSLLVTLTSKGRKSLLRSASPPSARGVQLRRRR